MLAEWGCAFSLSQPWSLLCWLNKSVCTANSEDREIVTKAGATAIACSPVCLHNYVTGFAKRDHIPHFEMCVLRISAMLWAILIKRGCFVEEGQWCGNEVLGLCYQGVSGRGSRH